MAAHAFSDFNGAVIRAGADYAQADLAHARTERVSAASLGAVGSTALGSAAHYLKVRLLERQALERGKGILAPTEWALQFAKRVGRLYGAPKAEGQHAYQRALFESEEFQRAQKRGTDWLVATAKVGLYRLELSIPAQARLLRYRAKTALLSQGSLVLFSRGRARGVVRRVLPLALLLGATAACSLVSGEGSGGQRTGLVLTPSLSKPKAAGERPKGASRKAPWSYVLPLDYGVRSDKSGQGHFRAPRFHGEHNGIDLLAPVGTPVFSPCGGQAMAGVSRSFGRWVHVICPVPDSFTKSGSARPWASFFYAHLDTTELPHNQWVDVSGAQGLGTVGKTGNAQSDDIQPHLHLELIIQQNKRAAMDERHVGSDQTIVGAATYFADALSFECMAPYGFEPKSRQLSRARRIDPFVALTCLSERKPNFEKPAAPLADWSHAWTQFYEAKDFNVNLGVEDSRLANK